MKKWGVSNIFGYHDKSKYEKVRMCDIIKS